MQGWKKKKLLIYAHYTYRILHQQGRFSVNLRKECWDKFDITVICVVPSYLGTVEERYKTQKYYKENINGVKIFASRYSKSLNLEKKTNKNSRIKTIIAYSLER